MFVLFTSVIYLVAIITCYALKIGRLCNKRYSNNEQYKDNIEAVYWLVIIWKSLQYIYFQIKIYQLYYLLKIEYIKSNLELSRNHPLSSFLWLCKRISWISIIAPICRQRSSKTHNECSDLSVKRETNKEKYAKNFFIT